MKPARSDALVFFGSTGDLAYKQIFPALEALVRHGRLQMPIVAVGRKDLPLDELRARARESIRKNGSLDDAAFAKLAAQMEYVKVDYDDPATFARIREALGGAKHPLHYVALPPDVFESVATSPTTFTAAINYAISAVAGADCSDQLVAAGGQYTTIPCTMSYTATATKQ